MKPGLSPANPLGPFPRIAVTVLAVTALLVVAYIVIQWWSAYHIYGLVTADVKDKLDSYKVQVDDLQRLVSLLVAFSSLYALVLGVSSYLSAQGLIKQAEDNILDQWHSRLYSWGVRRGMFHKHMQINPLQFHTATQW